MSNDGGYIDQWLDIIWSLYLSCTCPNFDIFDRNDILPVLCLHILNMLSNVEMPDSELLNLTQLIDYRLVNIVDNIER